jgi:hypothetical protein
MGDSTKDEDGTWLPVIGRSLAYLCLNRAQQAKPDDFSNVLDKVKFLTNLGLPVADAAHIAGSNPASVRVLRSRKKGGRGGRKE